MSEDEDEGCDMMVKSISASRALSITVIAMLVGYLLNKYALGLADDLSFLAMSNYAVGMASMYFLHVLRDGQEP